MDIDPTPLGILRDYIIKAAPGEGLGEQVENEFNPVAAWQGESSAASN
jgi:hypothetical protein